MQVLTAASVGALLNPTDGTHFALLSNGPGVVNPDGDGVVDLSTLTTLSTYRVTGPNASISFDFDFLTTEDIFDLRNPQNPGGSGNLDLFGFAVLGTSPVFVTGMVNDQMTLIAPGGFFVAPDGSTALFHTGIVHQTLVFGSPGDIVQFQFFVSDSSNTNDIDSELLIDNIRLTGLTAVPMSEPATIGLTGISILVMVGLRRLQRQYRTQWQGNTGREPCRHRPRWSAS